MIEQILEAMRRDPVASFVNGKADVSMVQNLQAMITRGEIYMAECQRLKVKFLPKQVMRPIWAGKGLPDGPLIKSRNSDFVLNFAKF